MRALITGGMGFIGSHLAHTLLASGHYVRILDNLSTGSFRNLEMVESGRNLDFIQGSVTSESLAEQAVESCDYIFHLAAQPSVPVSVAQPWETHEINLNATLRLLMLARQSSAKRFVFASSSAIYGDAGQGPVVEESRVSPLSPYGLHKFSGESYAALFYKLYGLPTVSLRFFNVFGPRQSFSSPYSGVIAKFCTALLSKERPKIFGDGLQSRDFVYVQNVVDALLLAVERPEADVAGRSFNIGMGRSVTLIDLLAYLQRLADTNFEPEYFPDRAADIRFSLADISSARNALGYSPAVDLETGLSHTFSFYRG